MKEYDKASKYQDAEDAKAQLEKAAVKAEKAAAAKPEDAKLAEAAAKARKAAEDAKAGVAIPETFQDYLQKWVYSICRTLFPLGGPSGQRRSAVCRHSGWDAPSGPAFTLSITQSGGQCKRFCYFSNNKLFPLSPELPMRAVASALPSEYHELECI